MKARWLTLVPLLAACGDSTGPDDWTHEGVIESGSQLVQHGVSPYADIRCEVDGDNVPTYTGWTDTDRPYCLRAYTQETRDGIVHPVYVLTVEQGPLGRRYRARVE